MRKFLLPLLLAATFMVVQAGATVITSIGGGTVYPFAPVNYFGPGPQTVAPGITWSSTNAFNQGGSVYGNTNGSDFGSNGVWDSNLVMAGLNDAFFIYDVTDTMTFAFANPVNEVGGFLNYVPDGITTPTTIAVYDKTQTLIESFTLTFMTGGGTDTGFFYGFQETTPISYFTLSDNYIGITNLTTNLVPEPGSLTLIGAGLLSVIGCGRRRLGL